MSSTGSSSHAGRDRLCDFLELALSTAVSPEHVEAQRGKQYISLRISRHSARQSKSIDLLFHRGFISGALPR